MANTAADAPEVLNLLTNVLLSVRSALPSDTGEPPPVTLPFTEWLYMIGTNISGVAQSQWQQSDIWRAWDASGYPPGYDIPGTDLIEDLIRDLPSRVSFRQNLFLVFLRAQTLARNGRVTADSASAVLLVRDAYTGTFAVRHAIPIH